MSGVKQVRVRRNILVLGALCILVLWLVRTRLWEYRDALALGAGAGLVYGPIRWCTLQRRIARRDRRYERNKIFVHYLNGLEVIIAALAHNLYLAIPVGIALLGATLLALADVDPAELLEGTPTIPGLLE